MRELPQAINNKSHELPWFLDDDEKNSIAADVVITIVG